MQGWRWSLIWAAAAATGRLGFTALPSCSNGLELALGVPLILFTFGLVVWYRGFTHEDRALFRKHGHEEPTPAAAGSLTLRQRLSGGSGACR